MVALAVGCRVGISFSSRGFPKNRLESSENLSARIVDEAKKEAETIKKEAVLQAKENLLKVKTEFEKDTRDRKSELENLERRLRSKEENLDKRIDSLSQKEANIENREKSWSTRNHSSMKNMKSCNRMIEEQKQKLEKIAGISSEEAKNYLIQSMEAEAKRDAAVIDPED